MVSTRARFTVSYVTVAMLVGVAFAMEIWRGRVAVAHDQVVAQATEVADGLIGVLHDAQSGGVRLTTVDTNIVGVSVHATQVLGNMLEPQPGYFFLIGPNNLVIYTSTLLRLLPAADRDRLIKYGTDLKPDVGAFVPISGDTTKQRIVALVARRPAAGIGDNIDRIVAGLPNDDVQLSGQLLIGTMIVMFPFILLICIGAADFMAGRVFKPMHDLTNQLEPITDGRHLHP